MLLILEYNVGFRCRRLNAVETEQNINEVTGNILHFVESAIDKASPCTAPDQRRAYTACMLRLSFVGWDCHHMLAFRKLLLELSIQASALSVRNHQV